MGEFSGRTVLVTGAGSGIGLAIAGRFAHAGATVIGADVSAKTRDVVEASGASFLQADLAEPAAVRALAQASLNKVDGRLDILVNNAGFQHIDKVEEFPEDKWVQMIQVMLIAPFQLIKHTLPAMKANRWGRIINISSVHGLVASPFKSAYVSAKHGLIGLTKSVALECGEFGVTVNAICPAYVRTPIVDKQIEDQARTLNITPAEVIDRVMLGPAAIKRLIEPDEVAEFAAYLAGPHAGFISGAAHALDLGWTAR